jgi:capsular polysaccharide biosynthesis protein
MGLREASRRILGRHALSICLAVIVGLCLAVALTRDDASLYAGAARIQLDSPNPQSQAESTALADGARAFATSPGLVATALRRIDVQRDQTQVARDRITVEAMGSSAVVQLVARDPNPQVAVHLANALAEELVAARLRVGRGQAPKLLATLDARIAELDRSLRETDDLATRARIAQERATLDIQRGQLLAADATQPVPAIVDRAETPVALERSTLVQALTIGALLGLLVGVGTAALRESFSPTLTGSEAIAREFGVPVLAELSGREINSNDVWNELLTSRLSLTLPEEFDEVEMIAIDSDGMIEALGVADLSGNGDGASDPVQTMLGAQRPVGPLQRRAIGVVAVVPTTVPKAALDPLHHILAATGESLVAVVTYRARGRRRRAPSSRPRQLSLPRDETPS